MSITFLSSAFSVKYSPVNSILFLFFVSCSMFSQMSCGLCNDYDIIHFNRANFTQEIISFDTVLNCK